jgi:hypothetical protein
MVLFSLIVILWCPFSISYLKDVIQILAIIIGAFILIFVYVEFTPKLSLQLNPKWINDFLILGINISNNSKVRANVQSICLQTVIHKSVPPELNGLSEWVKFNDETHVPITTSKCQEETESDMPMNKPIRINKSTTTIDPGEIIQTERLYSFKESNIIQFGLQVHVEFNVIGRLLKNSCKKDKRWTTTCFTVKPKD